MPEEVDESLELSSRDILSFSWRALKESRLVHPFSRGGQTEK